MKVWQNKPAPILEIFREGYYKLHAGEYVVPQKAVGLSGGTTVNILGGTYLSKDVAEEIGDMIIYKLKEQVRI